MKIFNPDPNTFSVFCMIDSCEGQCGFGSIILDKCGSLFIILGQGGFEFSILGQR